MAYNSKKLLEVLKDQIVDVPQRCEGYKEELARLLVDVIHLERDHAIARRNVVRDIADKVNKRGMFLCRSRSISDE